MRIELAKSVITAYDFAAQARAPGERDLIPREPLTRLPANESFLYLGFRASLVRNY